MECLAVLALIVLLVLIPLGQMLFGKGPNSLRRLMRPDLAAFFVLTAGAAIAFGIARVERSYGMACILVLVLPFALAFAWLGRYLLEDVTAGFGRRHAAQKEVDLSFLEKQPPEKEATMADLAEPDPPATAERQHPEGHSK